MLLHFKHFYCIDHHASDRLRSCFLVLCISLCSLFTVCSIICSLSLFHSLSHTHTFLSLVICKSQIIKNDLYVTIFSSPAFQSFCPHGALLRVKKESNVMITAYNIWNLRIRIS
jgi:hypothetical protein